jgi:universal stress protein E
MTQDKPLLNKLLIANDTLLGMDIALGKAARIEHYSGAELEVAEVIYDTVAEEPPEVLPPTQQALLIEAFKAAERHGLQHLVDPYMEKVANISVRVLWEKKSAAGILKILDGVDLLLKPVSQHHTLLDRLHAPLDWELMRNAECPVLISKNDWPTTARVVAALDAADAGHQALNTTILHAAETMAGILGADLHIVAAYPDLGQTVSELQVAMDYAGIKADMRASRAANIDTLIESLDLTVTEVHLLEGKPSEVIPQLANNLEVAVTVLGSAARKGASQLLLGNTAERIIGALNGDVLTVREPQT